MGHGGKRPGAGRAKGSKNAKTLAKEEARALLRAQVLAEMEPMTKAQIALSKGIDFLVVRDAKTGKFLRRITSPEAFDQALVREAEGVELLEVWAKEPSSHAYSYLMDQSIDKAAQPKLELDVTVKGLGSRIQAAKERLAKRGH